MKKFILSLVMVALLILPVVGATYSTAVTLSAVVPKLFTVGVSTANYPLLNTGEVDKVFSNLLIKSNHEVTFDVIFTSSKGSFILTSVDSPSASWEYSLKMATPTLPSIVHPIVYGVPINFAGVKHLVRASYPLSITYSSDDVIDWGSYLGDIMIEVKTY